MPSIQTITDRFDASRFVAEFMLDNTVGRVWYDMTKGETGLKDTCRYLVRHPHEVFLAPKNSSNALEQDDWVREVALTADFGKIPENPSMNEVARFALMIDGYAEMERLQKTASSRRAHSVTRSSFDSIQAFVDRMLNPQLEALENGAHAWTGTALELWCCLFMIQRKFWREGWCYSKNGDRSASDFFSCEPALAGLWQKIRYVLRNGSEGLSQKDALRQPVFIPHRPMRDPREIRMPELGCTSPHTGPCAFALFAAIYEEHIRLNPPPYVPPPEVPDPFPHKTVRKRANLRTVKCQYSHSGTDATTARVVILERDDYGDGLNHEGPYVVAQKTRFRPPVARELPFARFDYAKALRGGWMTPEQGRRMVLSSDAFTYECPPPPPTQAALIREYRKRIPASIKRHNLPGIETNPRAVNSSEPVSDPFRMLETFADRITPKQLSQLVKSVVGQIKQDGQPNRSFHVEDAVKDAIGATHTPDK